MYFMVLHLNIYIYTFCWDDIATSSLVSASRTVIKHFALCCCHPNVSRIHPLERVRTLCLLYVVYVQCLRNAIHY